MARYSVAEAKNNLPRLLAKAEAGEDVTITRRGEPVARIIAARAKGAFEELSAVNAGRPEVREVIARARERRARPSRRRRRESQAPS